MTNKNVSEPGNLFQVLISSFRMLSSRPKFFIPKILSTGLSAIWFIGIVSGSGNQLHYLAVLPLLILFGIAVSVMLAGMVKKKESDQILNEGLTVLRNNIGSIIKISVLMLLITFIISIPMSLGVYMYLVLGETPIAIILIGISLLLTLALSFGIYFLPITLIEKKGVLNGLKSSGSASISNSKEVMGLTLLSFALITVAFVSQGALEQAGYIGFFIGRMISAVVTTYLFVVSPEYYLSNN